MYVYTSIQIMNLWAPSFSGITFLFDHGITDLLCANATNDERRSRDTTQVLIDFITDTQSNGYSLLFMSFI